MSKVINFFTKPRTFEEFSLIIPSVSVGNVGQLTVDLLISTYNLKKIATIWHPAIIPAVGSNAFKEGIDETTTACELYISEDEEVKIAAIQLRSSIEISLALDFFEELKTAIVNLKFEQVFVLTSSYAHEKHTIDSENFRCISNSNCDSLKNLITLSTDIMHNGKYVVHGSGFAVKLFEILQDYIRTTVLIKYASEGDNRPDAKAMLALLKCVGQLGTNEKTLELPSSWNYVFGNPPPIGIY